MTLPVLPFICKYRITARYSTFDEKLAIASYVWHAICDKQMTVHTCLVLYTGIVHVLKQCVKSCMSRSVDWRCHRLVIYWLGLVLKSLGVCFAKRRILVVIICMGWTRNTFYLKSYLFPHLIVLRFIRLMLQVPPSLWLCCMPRSTRLVMKANRLIWKWSQCDDLVLSRHCYYNARSSGPYLHLVRSGWMTLNNYYLDAYIMALFWTVHNKVLHTCS